MTSWLARPQLLMMVCAIIILVAAARKWVQTLSSGRAPALRTVQP